jgi:hypothetical protein
MILLRESRNKTFLMLIDPPGEVVSEPDLQNVSAIRHDINIIGHKKALRVGPSTRLALLAGSG